MVTGCLPPSNGSDCLHISPSVLYSAVPTFSKVGRHTLTQCQLQIHISLWTHRLKLCLCSDLHNYDLSISKILVHVFKSSQTADQSPSFVAVLMWVFAQWSLLSMEFTKTTGAQPTHQQKKQKALMKLPTPLLSPGLPFALHFLYYWKYFWKSSM